MDNRKILENGTILPFPEMNCVIDKLIGIGSNSIVYLGYYVDKEYNEFKHTVLIKELFPFHPKGHIFRNNEDHICMKDDAVEMMEIHRLSFHRGNQIHLKLLEKSTYAIEDNVNTYAMNHTLYTILSFNGGRSLDKEIKQLRATDVSLRLVVKRMMGILDALETFHNESLLHLDISPENILLIGSEKKERISLIDFNSVHTLEETKNGTMYFSMKEGYTAPEVRMGKTDMIGFSSDLYALISVFYTLLTLEKWKKAEMLLGYIPDIEGIPCLKDQPDTVKSMVRKILKRGLSSTLLRRYQTIKQVRFDFEELLDRLDSKGITVPALWEAGRNRINWIVKTNFSLTYIRDDSEIYPVVVKTQQGDCIEIEKLMKKVISSNEESLFLIGHGGAGKTTALLRAMIKQPTKYTENTTSFVYISLQNWMPSNCNYIKNKILEGLKFKPHTQSLEMAREELIKLLSHPMYTNSGERTKLVILLDGLNEAVGELSELLSEIEQLSKLAGVKIVLTSRSDVKEIHLKRMFLSPLEENYIRMILSKKGLLVPESKEILKILETPLILSIFIKTSLGKGEQILVDSQEQLLDEYFTSISQKEKNKIPETDGVRWQIDAALFFVLPEIARHMMKKGHSLSDKELLLVINQCYKRLNQTIMIRIFPNWIGHIADIKGDAKDTQDWYGIMIHQILWRKLGLLIKDDDGKYRVIHQLVEEYLVKKDLSFYKKMRRVDAIKYAILMIAFILVMGTGYKHLSNEKQIPYDTVIAEQILGTSFQGYVSMSTLQGYLWELISCLEETQIDETKYQVITDKINQYFEDNYIVTTAMAQGFLDQLIDSGEVMPWSYEELDTQEYAMLITFLQERNTEYFKYYEMILYARDDNDLWEYFGEEFLQNLKVVMDADAYLIGSYYHHLIEPELLGMKNSKDELLNQKYTYYIKTYAMLDQQNEITKKAIEDIEIYKYNQSNALQELNGNGLFQIYQDNPIEENDAKTSPEIMSTINHLLEVWEDYLNVKENAYASLFWAYGYTEEFLKTANWSDLNKARSACIASSRYVNELSMSNEDLSESEYLLLSSEGIDTIYQSIEFARINNEVENLYSDVRNNIFESLEIDVFDQDNVEIIGLNLNLKRKFIELSADYTCGMTNYLLLTLNDYIDSEDIWNQFRNDYPIVFSHSEDWTESIEQVEHFIDQTLDELESTMMAFSEIESMNQAKIYELELQIQSEDRESFDDSIYQMYDAPTLLPKPEWYDPQNTKYMSYYVDSKGELKYPETGDDLTVEKYGMCLYIEDISGEEIGQYIDSINEYAFISTDQENHSWLITVDSYSVKITLEEDYVVFLFYIEDVTFAPTWYIQKNK